MSRSVNKVFVSYSHEDAEWARHLFAGPVRTTRGITLQTIDYELLTPGDDFDARLRAAIDDAAAYVFLVSKSFLKSQYVQRKEWKWIEQSHASPRICCIEIGKAFSKKHAKSHIFEHLKRLHRDNEAQLPKTIPKSNDDLRARVAAVHRSIARLLDPGGMRLIDRLEARGLGDIQYLGDGELAQLYTARTPTFRRRLAIKVPHEHLTEEFLHSTGNAEKMSAIPNFVKIREIDTRNQPFYCITEFVEGDTLESVIAQGQQENRPVPLPLARNVLLKLGLALRSAHAQGLSHLNIRPGNILVNADGEPFLLPTGRARQALGGPWDRSALAADPGQAFCTAPPEYFSGLGWDDQAADIYALGLVAYWLISGTPAETVTNRSQLAADADAEPVFALPPDLVNLRPDCPVSLARTVMRMLDPDPARRYASFDELLPGLLYSPDSALAAAELSWRRCLLAEQDIFSKFYERFFEVATSAEKMFEKPWPTPRQKNLLRDAVLSMFRFYDLKQTYRDIPKSLNPLEGIARQHAGRNIEQPHYRAFARALVDTVVRIDPFTVDTQADEEPVRRAWNTVVDCGVDYLEARIAELSAESRRPAVGD